MGGRTICVTDVFFVKEKEHNFQKNKNIVLFYLELREREEKKPNLSDKNLDRYLVVYFLCCLNIVSTNKLHECLV